MTKQRNTIVLGACLVGALLLVGACGCQSSADLSTFFLDFSREALAAFLPW